MATPAYLERVGRPERPEEIAARDTLGFAPETYQQTWELIDTQVESARVEHKPRLVCHDFIVLKAAVLNGLGFALLPEGVVRGELADGTLERESLGGVRFVPLVGEEGWKDARD